MKKLSLFFAIILTIITLIAQVPQSFKYQAVVRDNSGAILPNQTVGIRISIHDNTAFGPIVYQEIHTATTNQFGLVSLEIGTSVPTVGTFKGIDWSHNSKFIETEIDITGGTSYLTIGTTELLSVPYALYSESTGDTSTWKKSGTNLYYDKGNVGIGIANPNYELEVADTNPNGFPDIGLSAKDADGALAVYPSTLAAPFEHFADRLSLFSGIFTASGIDLRADGFSSDIRFYTGGPFEVNERMRIQSDGNTGIGITSPETILHCNTDTIFDPGNYGDRRKGCLHLSMADVIPSVYYYYSCGPAISFSGIGTSRRRAAIASIQTQVNSNQVGLAFYTHPGTAASNDEVVQQMIIKHDGKVGIGTNYPTSRFDVKQNGPDQIAKFSNLGEFAFMGYAAWGVYGDGTIGIKGQGDEYGVYGQLNPLGSGYGVYFEDGLAGSGTKSVIVKTDNGPTTLYCQESPENWFEDFGDAAIKNGIANVSVAKDFLQTVTINKKYPLKVFITPNDNIGTWWVKKEGTAFILYAPDAKDGATFDYRVVAKRKGYEELRLEIFEGAYTDMFLYPDIESVPDEYKEKWRTENEKRIKPE